MPKVGHFDAMLMGVGRDPASKDDLEGIHLRISELYDISGEALNLAGDNEYAIGKIQEDYCTSKNVNKVLRAAPPSYHGDQNAPPKDYDTLEWGDHLVWDFATGATHAPPVTTPQWMYVEMIKTYNSGSTSEGSHSALQRAWGYKSGILATRTRYSGTWQPWTIVGSTPPAGLPPDPSNPDGTT